MWIILRPASGILEGYHSFVFLRHEARALLCRSTMPGQGGIQLLPETRKSIEVRVPGENRWLYIGLGIFAVVLVIYAGLFFYVSKLETAVQERDAQLDALEKKRIQDQEKYDKVLVFSKQTGQIGKILREHVFWSKAFARIESRIIPQIQLKLFSASSQRQDISLNAYAPNFAVIARQVASFTNDEAITEVNLGNVKIDNSGRVEFGVTIRFDGTKFLRRADDEF